MFPFLSFSNQVNALEQLFNPPGQAANQPNPIAPGYAKQTALINMLSALLTVQDLTLEAELAAADAQSQSASASTAVAGGLAIGQIAPALAQVNKLQRELQQFASLVNNWFTTYSGQPLANVPAPPQLALFPDLVAFLQGQTGQNAAPVA